MDDRYNLSARFIEAYNVLLKQCKVSDKKDFATKIGISSSMMTEISKGRSNVGTSAIQNIVTQFNISADWLLTGAGEMLKDAHSSTSEKRESEDYNDKDKKNNTLDQNITDKSSPICATSQLPSVGTPYYDVDFIGGFDEVFNSQVSVPATNIVIRGFEKANLWCNVTGHSMEPKINHGDIIALRRCTLNDIQYGEIYAVVLDTIRTIKILRRSSDPTKLRFIPINTESYDEQEFEISRITGIFEVIGSISKFF